MNYHPLIIYFTIGTIIYTFVAYGLYFSFLNRHSFVFYYGLVNHAISSVLSVLAVITGFSVAGTQYIQQKAPFIFLFPHKWLGIMLALYTILTFVFFWIKQTETSRKVGLVLSVLGVFIAVPVLVFGWLLRLIFF